ncbi:hypothetical protein ACF05L_30205 [Streptomyces bobili]|uniref:hypothetical protein n=1 Tax=Streptomyces bobili TaxID=67280 RepID=UPI0036FBF1B4
MQEFVDVLVVLPDDLDGLAEVGAEHGVLLVPLGVLGQGLLDLPDHPLEVDDRPRRLARPGAVDAADGLHQGRSEADSGAQLLLETGRPGRGHIDCGAH